MFELVATLSRVNAQLLRILSPRIAESGLSVTELIILWKVNRKGPCKITEIISDSGIPGSTLTSLLDRLEARGYVSRTPDPADRRCIRIEGTPALQRLVSESVTRADGDLEKALADFPPESIDNLLTDLKRLESHLGAKRKP